MKKALYFSIIAIVFTGIALLIYKVINFPLAIKENNTNQIRKASTTSQKAKSVIKRYYVVATQLSGDRDNIASKELLQLIKNRKIIYLKKNDKDLAKIFQIKFETKSKNGAVGFPKIKLSKDSLAILRIDDLTPDFKVLSIDGKSIWNDDDYPLFVEVPKTAAEKQFDRSRIIRMTSVGDIMLSRTVYRKMSANGYLSPFQNVAAKLAQADITFGNLECPLSDTFRPSLHGMSFVAPRNSSQGLTKAGVDILGLANNHTGNFGARAFKDTLDVLKQNKIEGVGGGLTEAEAKNYKILRIKGKRFAFLNINAITGDIVARGKSPGVWHIDLAPWGRFNRKQISEVLKKIKEANSKSDFVVIMVHWGQEYTHDPNVDMRTLAHQLVDAGADLIIGTHPHWTQGVEIYKNRFIAYSLGNFIFDQEWSLETKQGLILDTIFYEGRLINVSFTPVLIEDFHRPRILDKKEGKPVMDAVWASSARIKRR